MIKVRKPSTRVVASISALVLGATAVAVGQAVPGGNTETALAKPASAVPLAGRGAPPPQHSRGGAPVRARAASSQDGNCEVGELCLYYQYSQYGWGSGYDAAHNDFNLTNNHFIFVGSGQGSVVGNNARAYWNRDVRDPVYVCNYAYAPLNAPPPGGQCVRLEPNTWGNLPAGIADREQSIYWVDSTN